MATKTRTTQYEKLSKRLGELDAERREVLKQLRNSPEYIVKILNDKLKAFTKSVNWFVRKNSKNEESYYRLNGFVIVEKSISVTEHGSVLIKVALTWDTFNYGSTEMTVTTEPNVVISAFNEIDAQILNGRVIAPNFSERVIKKNILTAQKKELEEKLKKVKNELLAI